MSDAAVTLEVTRAATTENTTFVDAEVQTADVEGTRLVRVKAHIEFEGHVPIKAGDALFVQFSHIPAVEVSGGQEGNGVSGGGGVSEPSGSSVDGSGESDHRIGSTEGESGGEATEL